MANQRCKHQFYECLECGDEGQMKTHAEERLIRAALREFTHAQQYGWADTESVDRAARAVQRERKKTRT